MTAAGGAMAQLVPLGDADRGRALYQDGRLADGSALEAERPGLPAVRGRAAACVQCHRHSGLGDQEGRLRVPPITAASLFGPGRVRAVGRVPAGIRIERHRAETRPPYGPESFRQALAQGLDSAGRALDPWMPRYALDAAALADLLAWLERLGPVGATQVRGLQGEVLHLATVLTPEAPAHRREAVQAVLSAWAQAQRFGATRVQLHVWALEGGSALWPAQLQDRLQAQPVFAVLSGAGGVHWEPVEAFCEAQALPCLFPLIDRVPAADSRFYSAYLSDGVRAEARLALRAAQALRVAPARLQLWFDGELGAEAAQEVQRRLHLSDEAWAERPVVLWDARVSAPTARAPAVDAGDLVLSWLSPGALAAVLASSPPAATLPRALWLSGQLAPPERVAAFELDEVWRARLGWLSLRSDPARFQASAALGLRPWLRGLGLPDAAPTPEQADLYAASFFFADALQLTRGAWSAEHLMERFELAVNQRAPSGGHVRLSLGPGQRIAAQMGQVLGYAPPGYRQLRPVSGVLNANE